MQHRTRLLVHLQLLSASGSALSRVPGLSQLLDYAAVADLVEVWDGNLVHLEGSASFDTDAEIPLGGFALGLGPPGSGDLVVPFSVTLPAGPVSKLLAGLSVAAGLVELGEVVDDLEGSDPQDAIDDAAAALGEVAVRVGPVTARLDFPEEWLQRGELVTDDGQVVDVEPVEGAPPVSVPVGQIQFEVRSSSPWFELIIDGPASGAVPLALPPAIIAETGVALELRDVIWHRGGDLPQQAADLGLPDDWRGLLIGEAHVWGLERLLPGMPEGDAAEDAVEGDPGDAAANDAVTAIGLHDWVIDADGVRGHVEIGFPPSDGTLRPKVFALEFDRSWWPVAMRAEADFDLGGLLGDDERLIEVTADLRLDPHADPGDRWELEVALRSDEDGALAELEGDALNAFGAACATLAVLAGDDAQDAGLLLGALAALDVAGGATGLAEWEKLAVEGASASVRPELVPVEGGGEARARVLRVHVDLRLAAALKPTGDEPIPIELGASSVTADLVLDSVDGLDRPRLSADWSLSDGLRVTLPAPVDVGGPVTITDASLRKTSDPHALVLELGVDPAGASDVAIGGLPDVVIITYLPGSGDIDISLGRSGQQITLLVPGALYAEGSLHRSDGGEDPLGGGVEWGEVLRGELRAFLVADGDPSGLDLLKKESYLFDLEVGLLSATSVDGSLQAFVLTLDAGFRPGLPLGTSGASLYGLGLTYAQNGAPAAIDGDYASWFMDDAPKYSTIGTKWVPQAGHWGFGASATLGSSPDSGTSWNVGAGLFVLLPGPVIMLTGEGDLFAELPQLPAEGGDPDEVDAAFAAVIVLDLLRDRFSLDLRGELEKSAGGQELLYVNIPAGVHVDLRDPRDFLVSLGLPQPEEDRIQASVLDLWDISAYLLVSGKPFDLPLRGTDDQTLPGVALALGGAGGLDKRFSAGPVAIELWARAGFDVGLSLSVPLLAGQVWVDGGIDASAFGFSVSMKAELTLGALAPDPFFLWGTVRIVIDLPWFLPDINFRAALEIGGEATWLDGAPDADSPVESLTLWDRGTGAPKVLAAGESDIAEGLPLDVIPELVFRVPVGNDSEEVGAVEIVGSDEVDPVWEVATTGDDDGDEERLGYRHVITDCVLRLADSGDEIADVRGTWPEGTENGNTPTATSDDEIARVGGGQVARTKLRLLDPLAATVDARVGLGAELTKGRWNRWDPCSIPEDDRKDILRAYTFRSLGHLLGRGGWRPPILDVDIRPIDGIDAGDDGDDDDDGPTLRPGAQIPDLDLDVMPDLPDIRPRPEVGDPDIGPRPGGPKPEPRPGGARPDPRPSLTRLPRGGREAVRARLRRSEEAAEAARDEDDESSLRPLEPLLASSLGIADAVLARPPALSQTLLSEPIALTSSLPLMWASSAGAVELEPGDRHYLPNETPPDELEARLVIEPLPESAGLWERTFGVVSEPARLGRNPVASDGPALDVLPGVSLAPDDPVVGLPRLLIPTSQVTEPREGGGAFATMAAGALGRARVDLPYSERAEAVLLLAPGVQPLVWAVGADGEERLLDAPPGQEMSLGGEGGGERWRLVRVSTNDPVVALRLAAFHGQLDPEPQEGRLPVAAALLAVGAHAPWRNRSGAARDSRDAYADLVSDLLGERDAWGDGEAAGVLEPDTLYELEVKGNSYPARELPDRNPGDLELGEVSPTPTWEHKFRFRTAAEPPTSLRALSGDAVAHDDPDLDPDDTDAVTEAASRLTEEGDIDELWQVATSPADGAPAHYLDDDLVVRLRDARTLAVFAAFDRQMSVRLINDEGVDVQKDLEARLREASDLPAHDRAVRDRLGELSCLLPNGANPDLLWQEAVFSLAGELDPGRRYVAELHAVTDAGSPDGEPLHRWRFRASYWESLEQHVAAHRPVEADGGEAVRPLDEVVPDGDEVTAALAAKLGDSGDRLTADDEVLDAWLVDTLRVPPRRPPDEPELALVWAWEPGEGSATAVALLLDGPEPLLRTPHAGVRVTSDGGGEVETRVVTGRTRARVLVVPESGALPTGTLTLTVESRGASHTRSLVVGDLPAVLVDGGA